MDKSCVNCAWYCHADTKCYVPGFTRPCAVNGEYSCHDYTFDGLKEWEREEHENN